jgi:hypothetical protein
MVSRRQFLAGIAGTAGVFGTASFTHRSEESPEGHSGTRMEGFLPAEELGEDPGRGDVKAHVIEKGSHRGENNFAYFLDRASPGLDPDQPDEVFSRVYVKFDSGWHQPTSADTCKLYWAGCNLSAGPAGQGGNRPTGADGWSVRVYSRGPVEDGEVAFGSYVYHLDQSPRYGDLWTWPDSGAVGTWNRIDSYVKLNSVSDGLPNRDGVVRSWLNGDLQLDRDTVRWRTTEDLGFDRLGPGSYWGGQKPSPETNILYYDLFGYVTNTNELKENE